MEVQTTSTVKIPGTRALLLIHRYHRRAIGRAKGLLRRSRKVRFPGTFDMVRKMLTMTLSFRSPMWRHPQPFLVLLFLVHNLCFLFQSCRSLSSSTRHLPFLPRGIQITPGEPALRRQIMTKGNSNGFLDPGPGEYPVPTPIFA